MTKFDCYIHQEDKDEIWDCLSCYDAGIVIAERKRIADAIWKLGIEVPLEGFTERDADAMNFALQQFKLAAIPLIKGEQK